MQMTLLAPDLECTRINHHRAPSATRDMVWSFVSHFTQLPIPSRTQWTCCLWSINPTSTWCQPTPATTTLAIWCKLYEYFHSSRKKHDKSSLHLKSQAEYVSVWVWVGVSCFCTHIGNIQEFGKCVQWNPKFCSHTLSPCQWHVAPSAFFQGFGSEKNKSKLAEEATCPWENTKHRSMRIYSTGFSVFLSLNGTPLPQRFSINTW